MNTLSPRVSSFQKNKRLYRAAIVIALGLLSAIAFPAATQAEVIYRQTFGYIGGTGSATRTDLGYVGWKALAQIDVYSATSPQVFIRTDPITDTPSAYYFGIRNAQGAPINLDNVGTPTPSESLTQGVATIFRADYVTHKGLFYTDHFTIDQSVYQLDSVSWYSAASSTNASFSLSVVLRIDGQWYMTTPVSPGGVLSPNDVSGFASKAVLRTVSLADATWYTLGAMVGDYFTIGETAVTLPSIGEIDAFGLYATTTNSNGHYLMFDNFTLNATVIPEPGTWTLLGLGVVLLISRRRRG